jgi:2-keto-4-pentenoate hydratase/2-oxohepta-3-ene-1,7-dioic acid hydratase in catechol pathway
LRLVSFENEGQVQAGVLFGEEIAPLATLNSHAATMREALAALEREGPSTLAERAGETERRLRLTSIRLKPPVTDPEKIIRLGLNYRDHAAEIGQEPPAAPLWFAKLVNSLIGSGVPAMGMRAGTTRVTLTGSTASARA